MPDWSGSDTLVLNVTDLGNVGAGGALAATGQVQISVSPVNDPPEILIDPQGFGLLPSGGALGTDENVPLPLALLSVQDKEMSAGGGGRLTVSVQCSNGGFAIASNEAAAPDEQPAIEVVWAVGGDAEDAGTGPWQTVVFSGGIAESNGVLGNLEYTPSPDWHGVDDLHVRLRRQNGCVSNTRFGQPRASLYPRRPSYYQFTHRVSSASTSITVNGRISTILVW